MSIQVMFEVVHTMVCAGEAKDRAISAFSFPFH